MSRIYDALKRSGEPRTNKISETIDAIQSEVETGELAERVSSVATLAAMEPEPVVMDEPFGAYQMTLAVKPASSAVFPFNGSDAIAAEQYRMLRTNLVQHPAQPHVLAISSATSGDGKSTTTINLGGTFALKSESNVLIIDADLRRCSVAASLGLEVGRGLTDVLRGECAVDDAIVRLDQMPNLHVLASRRSTTNPAELLDSPAWKNLIQDLRERFSYILIDTTPMQAVADFKLVQQVVDGVVMVVRPDHTSRPALERALTTADDKLLGLVVNAYEDWFLFDSSHNYGYYAS